MVRTGQVSLLEQTVLMGAGLAIALGFLVAFQQVESGVTRLTQQAETSLIAKYLAAQTVSLAQGSTEGTVNVDIPDTIGGQQYGVRMTDGGVVVITSGASSRASLNGLGNIYTLEGSMVSRNQPARITRENMTLTVDDSR